MEKINGGNILPEPRPLKKWSAVVALYQAYVRCDPQSTQLVISVRAHILLSFPVLLLAAIDHQASQDPRWKQREREKTTNWILPQPSQGSQFCLCLIKCLQERTQTGNLRWVLWATSLQEFINQSSRTQHDWNNTKADSKAQCRQKVMFGRRVVTISGIFRTEIKR